MTDPSDFRDFVLENIPNSLLSLLRLQFREILDNSCNIEVSTEQEEAVLDLFEVDVRAVVLAAVECNLVELLLNDLPKLHHQGYKVFEFFQNFAVSTPTNFAQFSAIFLRNFVIGFPEISDPAFREEVQSSFSDGVDRCVSNILTRKLHVLVNGKQYVLHVFCRKLRVRTSL